MKKKSNNLINYGIFLLIGILIGLAVSYMDIKEFNIVRDKINGLFADKNISYQEILESCENKNAVDTAYCLIGKTKPIYNYVITEDSISLSFEELKLRGGDCMNWANYYAKLGNELGFYTNTYSFQTTPETRHVVASISDPDAYCILDQEIITCIELGVKK